MEKKLAQSVAEVRQQYPDATAEVWAEDEHWVGLHPVNRRMWTPADEPPVARVIFIAGHGVIRTFSDVGALQCNAPTSENVLITPAMAIQAA